MKRLRLPFALLVFTLAASLPAAETGASDPAGLPRPAGLERRSYSSSFGGSQDSETADYHSAADFDTMKADYGKALAAEGWRLVSSSDSSSGPTRVAIIDWELGNREAEVRIYGRKDPGTDVWVRVTTYKKATAAPAPATPAKAAAPAGAVAATGQGPGSDANLVIVPDVGGKTKAETESLLKSSKLGVAWGPDKPVQNRSDAVPATVCAQDPAAGKRVARGTTVTLALPVFTAPVPNVQGKKYDEAQRLLQAPWPGSPNFHVQRMPDRPTTRWSDAGCVAEQSPAAGTMAADGSTVTLTVWERAGPVPNEVGMQYALVQDLLGNTGGASGIILRLQRGPDKPTTDSKLVGLVAEQSPAAGTMVMDNSTLTLTVWGKGALVKAAAPAGAVAAAEQGPASDTHFAVVPDLTGKTKAEAESLLKSNKLGVAWGPEKQVLNRRDAVPAAVCAQDPVAGKRVARGTTVTLIVAVLMGPVPNVVGRGYSDAQSYLGSGPSDQPHFHVQRASADKLVKDLRLAGQVVEQSPAAGAMAADGATVTLRVAKWDNTGPVPNVVGARYDDAKMSLGSSQSGGPRYQVARAPADKPNTDPGKAGLVAEQSPAAGATAADGSTVTLTVWSMAGPVPDVSGRGYNDAVASLSTDSSGRPRFHAERAPADKPNTDRRKAGLVVEQSPVAGTMAAYGTTVTLTVAKWDNTGPVPNVVGARFDDAKTSLGYGPSGGPRYQAARAPADKPNTDPSKAGLVAEQSPAAGAMAADGSTVTLTVWSMAGPVPDVSGRGYYDAVSSLSTDSSGRPRFHAERAPADKPNTDRRKDGQVVEQSPAAGTMAAYGTTVTLTVAKWDNTGPVPNVVGARYDDAKTSLGYGPSGGPRYQAARALADKPNTDPGKAGRVAEQSPAAGAMAADGSTVTLTLWSKTGPVPNLVGRGYNEAQSYLGSGPSEQPHFHAQRATVDKPTTDASKVGQVAEQVPAAGTMAADGATVTLTVWGKEGPAKAAAPAGAVAAAEQGPVSDAHFAIVPDLAGKTKAEAESLLKSNQLGVAWGPDKQVLNRSDAVPATVCAQDPVAGKRVARGSTVTLVVAVLVGPVPNVVGKDYTSAKGSLETNRPHFDAEKGLAAKTKDSRQAGKVAVQNPAAGAMAAEGTVVMLAMYEWDNTGPVPDVVGKTYYAAKTSIETRPPGGPHFYAEKDSWERPNTDPSRSGLVAGQNPAAGAMLADNHTVTVTLWSKAGPVPNVVGKTYYNAQTLLESTSSGGPRFHVQKATGSKRNTDPHLSGLVAEQNPAAGVNAGDGTTVTLTIWETVGPVPNVVGKDYTSAKGSLESGRPYFYAEKGFTAKTKDSRQANKVAVQDPAAGTIAAEGTTVMLRMNEWDNTGPVPDVVGKTYYDAKTSIETRPPGGPHFYAEKDSWERPNTDPSRSGLVAGQNPAAGAVIADGHTVTVTLWSKAGPVPDVVGRTYADAQAILTGSQASAGAPKFHVQRGPDVLTTHSRLDGAVVAQSPAAGTMAADGATVTLTLYKANP